MATQTEWPTKNESVDAALTIIMVFPMFGSLLKALVNNLFSHLEYEGLLDVDLKSLHSITARASVAAGKGVISTAKLTVLRFHVWSRNDLQK